MFLVNSRLALFTAAHQCFPREVVHKVGHPFFLSYGMNWPSSLTRVVSITLGYSPHPPESVYGTGTHTTHNEVFLGSMESGTLFPFRRAHSLLKVNDFPDLPGKSFYKLGPRIPTRGCPILLRHPFADNAMRVVAEYQRHVHRLRPSASA